MASPLITGYPHPIRGRVGSRVDGAEALRFVSKLSLFPLRVCSPVSQYWYPCSRGEQCWSKSGLCGLSACNRAQAVGGWPQTEVWSASNVFSAQPPAVAVTTESEYPLFFTADHYPLVVEPYHRQVGPAWAFCIYGVWAEMV